MFEKIHHPLASRKVFYGRVAASIAISMVAITIALFVGMLGYYHFENMAWPDAFVNAAMILSGMGPIGEFKTTDGKIFAGLYALFSGLFFILIISIIFAPVVHRFFHSMHIDDGTKAGK